jgi:D-amino-acid dehydrogenase
MNMNREHWVVLGAGVVGVATAWHLQKMGYRVTVVDRQPEVAQETSFANGGQLSFGHVEPWAGWRTLPKLLKWSLSENSPILFRLRVDRQQWSWGRQFLGECRTARRHYNYRQLFELARFSRQVHRQMERDTGIEYQASWKGIIHLHASAAHWQEDQETTRLLSGWGCQRHSITMTEAIELEPALAHSRHHWAGATYLPEDGSGDAFLWTQALAAQCRQAGVDFLLGHEVKSLVWQGGRVGGVRMKGALPLLSADGVVVCMGCGSVPLLAPLGLSLPIYPVKGYSVTFPIKNPEAAPAISITDTESKTVLTRLGNQFRIAGTAEFVGEDYELNPVRTAALVARARQLFPLAAHFDQAECWSGLRPATPSNRPIIGRVAGSNLFLNTGHGTLGWTLSSGSARLVASLIAGEAVAVDFDLSAGL